MSTERYTVVLDTDECVSAGKCVASAPGFFVFDDDQIASVDQAGPLTGKAIEPALGAHQLQRGAQQPGAEHPGGAHVVDQGLQAAGGGQGAGGVKHPAEQPRQRGGLQVGGVVVAALHHRQGGLTDGEHVARLQHGSGVMAQHLGGIVEGSEQMGADRQHRAAITAAPTGGVGLGRRRTA